MPLGLAQHGQKNLCWRVWMHEVQSDLECKGLWAHQQKYLTWGSNVHTIKKSALWGSQCTLKKKREKPGLETRYQMILAGVDTEVHELSGHETIIRLTQNSTCIWNTTNVNRNSASVRVRLAKSVRMWATTNLGCFDEAKDIDIKQSLPAWYFRYLQRCYKITNAYNRVSTRKITEWAHSEYQTLFFHTRKSFKLNEGQKMRIPSPKRHNHRHHTITAITKNTLAGQEHRL